MEAFQLGRLLYVACSNSNKNSNNNHSNNDTCNSLDVWLGSLIRMLIRSIVQRQSQFYVSLPYIPVHPYDISFACIYTYMHILSIFCLKRVLVCCCRRGSTRCARTWIFLPPLWSTAPGGLGLEVWDRVIRPIRVQELAGS